VAASTPSLPALPTGEPATSALDDIDLEAPRIGAT
jgi:hypothetical protein